MKHDLLKNDPRCLTRPIGQHFFDHDVELEVFPSPNKHIADCKGCYYEGKICFDSQLCRGFCTKHGRTDRIDVIFKEVKS